MSGKEEIIKTTDDSRTVNDSSESRSNPYTITEKELLERSRQRGGGRIITQCYVTMMACISAMAFGVLLGWPMSHGSIYETTCPWIWSLIPLGCFVALNLSFYAINNLGPKKLMLIDTPIYIISHIGILHSPTWNYFLMGACSIVYIVSSENLLINAVHIKNLKYVILMFRTSRRFGYLLMYLVKNLCDDCTGFILVMTLLLTNAILLIIMPESPKYLYDKNEKKSIASIKWYQGSEHAYSSIHLIRNDYESSKDLSGFTLFSKSVFKAMLVIIIVNFFRVFSGYYTLMFYRIPKYHKSLIVRSMYEDSLIYSMNLVISNMLGSYFHIFCNLGIRRPLLIGGILITIALTMQTSYIYLLHIEFITPSFPKMYYIPIILENTLVIGYEIGYSICADLLVYEYIPYKTQSLAKIIIYSFHWFYVYLVTTCSIIICNHDVDLHISFFILAVMSVVGNVYCYLFVVESKGKNFAQLQMALGGNPTGNRSHRNYLFYQINSIT